MTLLATFKHISSKNADYGAAEAYLTFEHDEFTMKPTLDENGRLIPREDYRISSLNCGDGDFAVACMRANLRYEKNQKREDVKSHHYIISFDPRDGTDNGLTVDRAQELGEQFCKAHFPGHQALVCTHPDGHNHSGNIHVHIVINSLRIYEVPLLPYMDRPADTREGCKHRCTNAAMEYFKSEVMEMCHREGLYQIDLLNGSKERITEREYWAAKKGQLALDKENAVREAAGQPTKPTKFETDKAKLRRTIRQALSQATSFDEFSSLLLREGVTVKESRGRLSYLTPDRTKPITARKLGDDFDKATVLALLTQNARRAAEKTTPIPEYPHTQKERLREEKAAKTTPADNTLQRMVDREAKRAEGKGVGYDRWAAKHNATNYLSPSATWLAFFDMTPYFETDSIHHRFSEDEQMGSMPTVSIYTPENSDCIYEIELTFDDHGYQESLYEKFEEICLYSLQVILPALSKNEIDSLYKNLYAQTDDNFWGDYYTYGGTERPLLNMIYYYNGIGLYGYYGAGTANICIIPMTQETLIQFEQEGIEIREIV